MRPRLGTAIVLALLVGMLFPGCTSNRRSEGSGISVGRTDAGRDLSGRPGNVYQVQYSPNTVVIERSAAVRALQSVSTDGTVFVFDNADPAFSALAPGKVMLLEKIALRKVSAVQRDGSRLAILTEPATLAETIQNGTIRWSMPVHFADIARQQARLVRPCISLSDALFPVALADAGHSVSGEKNGWKYALEATPGEGRLNLALSMSKNVNNIEVKLDATGYIPDFDTVAAIVIGDSSVKKMDFQNSGLSGDVQFTISAATKGDPGGFGKKQVRLPAVLKTPFFLGALPFTLEISSAITFTPGLGANNQLMSARFRLTYNDLHGFSFEGGSPAKGNGSSDGDGEILDAKGLTLAGIGVVAGVSMPRVEFKLGTTSFVDIVAKALPAGIADALQQTLFGNLTTKGLEEAEESIKTEGAAHVQVVLIGSFLASGPLSLIPCQKTTFSFTANAGADATVVGKKIAEIGVDLFKKEIVKSDPPNRPCG